MDRDQLYNDPEESWRTAFAGSQCDIWTALPGIVQSVDFTDMTCSVQPAVQGTITDLNGIVKAVNLPLLIKVPIIFPQAGGFALTLPLAANDEVLIIWASRCIDAWWQQSGIQPPMEVRMHDLSDGFAIPGPTSVPNTVTNVSSTNAQLRTKDGTSYLEITPSGQITVKAPGGFIVQGNMHVTGSSIFDGTVNATGDVIVSGNITGTTVKEGLIQLGTHKHGGVSTGTGDSGGPIP